MGRPNHSRSSKILSWAVQILAAVVLFQTLYYKFSGGPETVYIFETIGMEPWGRYISGLLELVAAILLLLPRISWVGAMLGLGMISFAIYFHFTQLGIEIKGDGGALFYLAVTVFVSCVIILLLRRHQLKADIRRLMGKSGSSA